MIMDSRASRREALEKCQQLLVPQYEAALIQSALAADDVTRVKAEQQADQIGARMKQIDEQIAKLELALPTGTGLSDPGRDCARVDTLLERDLHHIDFKQLRQWIRALLDAELDPARAGLVMIQRSSERNGRLCAKCVEQILRAATRRGKFRHFPVNLGTGDHADVGAVLRGLAGHLDPSLGLPVPAQVGLVTAALCRSLQAGNVVLIEIDCCEYLLGDPAAVQWMVAAFWRQLLADLALAAPKLHGTVTIVALLLFGDTVPEEALAAVDCCRVDDFRPERLLEIELTTWNYSDVLDWLTRWGLPDGHPPEQTRLLARTILNVTQGDPMRIAQELLHRCAAL